MDLQLNLHLALSSSIDPSQYPLFNPYLALRRPPQTPYLAYLALFTPIP